MSSIKTPFKYSTPEERMIAAKESMRVLSGLGADTSYLALARRIARSRKPMITESVSALHDFLKNLTPDKKAEIEAYRVKPPESATLRHRRVPHRRLTDF